MPSKSCLPFLQSEVIGNVKAYVIGFASIEAAIGLFAFLNGIICLRKCKRKMCKSKKGKKNKKEEVENTVES